MNEQLPPFEVYQYTELKQIVCANNMLMRRKCSAIYLISTHSYRGEICMVELFLKQNKNKLKTIWFIPESEKSIPPQGH